MRHETVTMATRFLDAAFGGDVEAQMSERGLVVKVNYLRVAHKVIVAPELLDLEPAAVMAPLRDVLPTVRRAKAPVRVLVTAPGF